MTTTQKLTIRLSLIVVLLLENLCYLCDEFGLYCSGFPDPKAPFIGHKAPNLGWITTFSYPKSTKFRVWELGLTPETGGASLFFLKATL
ncbi:MAG: hypothetical protein ACRBG0_05005 [Lewinella sp.]|uniref:hypothetical protein n=1 Tax=Lewinella sp. TaxID=2004506 RepID=UPI003D6B64ED